MRKFRWFAAAAVFVLLPVTAEKAEASSRIKDIVDVEGIREKYSC